MNQSRTFAHLTSLCLVALLAGCAKSQGPVSESVQAESAPAETPATVAIQPAPTFTGETDPYFQKRQDMVDKTILARGVSDPKVLEAMRAVPRHLFVPLDYLDFAYNDNPLPIGYGQTISQPYMVALMTELLELTPGEKVLEIGTGSGYQAAILAALGDIEVYSLEIVPELAESAATRLQELDLSEIQVMQADGYYGWPEYAPFDAIIVTAAPDHLPAPLVEQLTEGGRLVIPIGPQGGFQTLWKFVFESEELKGYNLGWVSFVPFTGGGIAGDSAAPTTMP